MKKIAAKFAFVTLIAMSASSHAAVDIDLTTASIGIAPQNTVNISNISYGGAKYDATLQWNPLAGRFDVTTAVLSSGNLSTKKCSLGKIIIYSKEADVTLTMNSSDRTITIAYTPSVAFSDSWGLDYWTPVIIQNKLELNITTDSGKLTSNTALYSHSPDPTTGATVSWSDVPSGSTRYAKITKIPSWFDFNLPISSIFNTRLTKTYSCM